MFRTIKAIASGSCIGVSSSLTICHSHRLLWTMSALGPASTSQNVTLPHIPELFDPDFLNVLLPPRSTSDTKVDVPQPENALVNALKSVSHRKFTENASPAFNSTLSPTLDAFNSLSFLMTRENINMLLSKAWEEDPNLALRIIWNTRSIHDGKGDKELFYKYVPELLRFHPADHHAGFLAGSMSIIHARQLRTSLSLLILSAWSCPSPSLFRCRMVTGRTF